MTNLPVLFVQGETLAETYELGLIKLYENGIKMRTQYDKEGDPSSIDATMNLTILNPLKDPMIHKFFIGGIEDLREYVYELEGLKNCICRNENDVNDTRWEYLYSSRMTNYGTWIDKTFFSDKYEDDDKNFGIAARYENKSYGVRTGHFEVNQIEKVIEKLAKQPFTRQAQIITWMPNMDLDAYDPPCLQSLQFRLIPEEDKTYTLNTNIRFRSNDASRAFFQNCFGFIQFINHKIIKPLSEKLNTEIHFGRINWHADSWHIYGSEIANFEKRFYNRLKNTFFEDRVINFYDPDIQFMYKDCEANILNKFEEIKKSFGIIS